MKQIEKVTNDAVAQYRQCALIFKNHMNEPLVSWPNVTVTIHQAMIKPKKVLIKVRDLLKLSTFFLFTVVEIKLKYLVSVGGLLTISLVPPNPTSSGSGSCFKKRYIHRVQEKRGNQLKNR